MSGIWVCIIMLGLVAALGYILVVAVRLEAQAELLQDEDRLDLIVALHNANAYARRNQLFDKPKSIREHIEETEAREYRAFMLDTEPAEYPRLVS